MHPFIARHLVRHMGYPRVNLPVVCLSHEILASLPAGWTHETLSVKKIEKRHAHTGELSLYFDLTYSTLIHGTRTVCA